MKIPEKVKEIINYYVLGLGYLEKFVFPILLLIMRIWMARIFWYSGLTKINSWNSTILLFKYEYKVPVFSPEVAAYFATFFELTCPVLLFFGLATRFATLPMLVMTAVIQFTYLDLIDHTYWAMLLSTILLYGPGLISIDFIIKKYIKKII